MQQDTTPKHFVMQFGALITLYVSLSFLITLLFTIVNLHIPDATDASWRFREYISTARLAIAVVLVFFPAYLILTALTLRARQSQSIGYLKGVRWLLYLSFLVAGAILLGNLVSLIVSFLEGEVTLRFILKVASMVVIVGGALGFYLLDVREYWLLHPRRLRAVAVGAIAVAIAILSVGFYGIYSPSEARERSLDQQQVQDLQNIAHTIDIFLEREGHLPDTLAAAYRSPAHIPSAPEDRPDYRYQHDTDRSYELCATFSHDSDHMSQPSYPRPTAVSDGRAVDWNYEAGEWCVRISTTPPVERLRDMQDFD